MEREGERGEIGYTERVRARERKMEGKRRLDGENRKLNWDKD